MTISGLITQVKYISKSSKGLIKVKSKNNVAWIELRGQLKKNSEFLKPGDEVIVDFKILAKEHKEFTYNPLIAKSIQRI